MHRLCIVAMAIFIAPCCSAQVSLPALWKLEAPDRSLPQTVAVDSGNPSFLYCCLQTGGLRVYQHADTKSPPKQVASLPVSRFQGLAVMDLAQHDDRLFLALGDFFGRSSRAGLAIVGVRNPLRPKLISMWQSDRVLEGSAVVAVNGNLALLGMMRHGIAAFDIANPKRIRKLSSLKLEVDYPRKNPSKTQHPNARGMCLHGNYLYVTNDAGGLRIVDVSKPTQLKEITRYANRALIRKQQAYNNIVVDKGIAYIGVDYAGVEILDVRNPSKPQQIAWWNPWNAGSLKNVWFNSPGHVNQVRLDSKNGLLYVSAGDSELQVLDISNPKTPRLVARHGSPGNKKGAWGVALGADAVYLTYIRAVVPFQAQWSGIKAVQRFAN